MLKNPASKYQPFPAIPIQNRQWPSRTITHVTFEELKSGKITVNDRVTPTVPVTSYSISLEIAETLKKWIEEGKFLLTEPQCEILSM